MKNFIPEEYYTDFSTFPIYTIYSFVDPDNQLAALDKLVLDYINH